MKTKCAIILVKITCVGFPPYLTNKLSDIGQNTQELISANSQLAFFGLPLIYPALRNRGLDPVLSMKKTALLCVNRSVVPYKPLKVKIAKTPN
jgi:hypothetical protein